MSKKQDRYTRLIKKFLYFNGASSVLEISKAVRMSIPATVKHLDNLIAGKEVSEAGLAKSSGGRRPQLFSLIKDQGFIVSVWVDQLITRLAILNLNNETVVDISKTEFPLSNEPEQVFRFANIIREFVESSGVPMKKIIGVGIGMPGFIDIKRGLNHSFFHTDGKSIVGILESELGLPVLIDNDSSLIALAEHRFGIARGKQDVMVINLGWGIGLGIIQNGNLFRGHNGFAGEFSHIPLFTNNKICSCGKTGCLETETSLKVILSNITEELERGKPSVIKKSRMDDPEKYASEVMQAAVNGDRLAIDVISKAAYHIGRGIAILVHILNPELVVLSGIGAIGGKVWLAPILQAINEHCIPKIAEHLHVKVSDMSVYAGIRGAAALVIDHYEELNIKKTHQLVTDQAGV